MPCRKDSFLLLEQSVTVGSQEVDSLVARIGEALQLGAHRARPSPVICSCVRGRTTPYPLCTPRGAGRYHQQPPGPRHCAAGSKQLCGRGWVRGGCRKHGGHRLPENGEEEEEEEDPHRLLQELLISGNLIKEAVRRLHMSGEDSIGEAGPCKVAEPKETTVQ